MRGVGEWSRQDVRHQADLTVECKVRLRNWLQEGDVVEGGGGQIMLDPECHV